MAYKVKETLTTPEYIRKYGREPKTVRCPYCSHKLLEFEEPIKGIVRLKCRRCSRSLELTFYTPPASFNPPKAVEDIGLSTSV